MSPTFSKGSSKPTSGSLSPGNKGQRPPDEAQSCTISTCLMDGGYLLEIQLTRSEKEDVSQRQAGEMAVTVCEGCYATPGVVCEKEKSALWSKANRRKSSGLQSANQNRELSNEKVNRVAMGWPSVTQGFKNRVFVSCIKTKRMHYVLLKLLFTKHYYDRKRTVSKWQESHSPSKRTCMLLAQTYGSQRRSFD